MTRFPIHAMLYIYCVNYVYGYRAFVLIISLAAIHLLVV